ncbi:HNH endonuclease [Burkholderia dolosa]|uniref:NUMOD4 domain-containing protein n=1 Tax=Burkholderia dolosa TaxID=152500 RepID=UPI001BA21F17|nr:NUMOD4 domain-containing protein [Burkholderia dolosa]MBR8460763.1 HNH endonuclease [Burkholderia dolosa]
MQNASAMPETGPEQWADIEGFVGLYQVSDLGNVRSVSRGKRKGRILKICYDRDGYPLVSLSRSGKRHNGKVHRLVAAAFIPNPHAYPEIDHLDGVKANCAARNLEWVSRKENAARAASSGLYCRGAKHHRVSLTVADVRDIRRAVAAGEKKKAVAKRFSVDPTTITNITTGRTWGHVPFTD